MGSDISEFEPGEPHPQGLSTLLRHQSIDQPKHLCCAVCAVYLLAIMDWACRKVLTWRPIRNSGRGHYPPRQNRSGLGVYQLRLTHTLREAGISISMDDRDIIAA